MVDNLRAQLGASGALFGVPVIVTDDLEWHLDSRGLSVGLDWYRSRGHSDREAVALALLQIWQAIRGERQAPERARRRRTLAASMPQADPLIESILRLQCAAELLTVMPGMRSPLAAATYRSALKGISELPRHLQWVTILMLHGAGAEFDPAEYDPVVLAEWNRLPWAPDFDPIRRVIASDTSRTTLQRFERALALLLPAYEKLLAIDLADHGLSSQGEGSAVDGEGLDEGRGAAAGGDTDDDAPVDGDSGDEDEGSGEPAAADGDEDRARAGESRDVAEGADLFEAEHAAFVSAMLPTPMPAGGTLFEATLEALVESTASPSDSTVSATITGAPGGASLAGRTALATYRSRAEALAEPIERMRKVWEHVILERVTPVQVPGRNAYPEGDSLVSEALASAVAEALSGVARPDAYRQRERRLRRAHRAGSTDYVLLIDRSASMSGPVARAAADAVLIMLEALAGAERDARHAERLAGISLELDIRTALIMFDAEAHVVKPLSGGLDDEVRRAVHAATSTPGGATNDSAALNAAAEQLGISLPRALSDTSIDTIGQSVGRTFAGTDRGGVQRRRIVIVLSDGGSNDEIAATHALRRLRAAGVRVHGVGVGSDEIVRRYAPTSSRIDDPRAIADALHQLVEDELP